MFWRIPMKIDPEPKLTSGSWSHRSGKNLARDLCSCSETRQCVSDNSISVTGQTSHSIQTTHEEKAQMKKLNRFPKGWNEARVREVLEHYEGQTEEEAVAEDEAAYHKRNYTVVVVPKRLVPAITKLVAREKAAASRARHNKTG